MCFCDFWTVTSKQYIFNKSQFNELIKNKLLEVYRVFVLVDTVAIFQAQLTERNSLTFSYELQKYLIFKV